MKTIKFSSCDVKGLQKQMVNGVFAVPKLQRAFVWNGKKAAKLLDSIYLNMPIGPITLWDTQKKNKNLLRHTSHVIPPFNEVNPAISFVLDGQQRLSVIHKAAIGGVQRIGRGKEVDFDRVVFRVTEGDRETRFAYRKPVAKQWISVCTVLAPKLKRKALCRDLTEGQMRRVNLCAERLSNYDIPLIRVECGELEEVREFFLRINSLGTPLATADRAFARASAFDLRQTAEETIAALPLGFQTISNEVLLQTRALLDGTNDVGEKSITAVVRDWDERVAAGEKTIQAFTKAWDLQTKSINRALDFLKVRFKVIDGGMLPSQYMVATLACFFHAHARQPNAQQVKELKRWFWGTALGQRYSGRGFRTNILADVEFFSRLANGHKIGFKLGELIDPADIVRTRYGQRSSIGDAISCLLVLRKPCYLQNGEEIQLEGYASAANRKHQHHIFPRYMLSRKGVPLKDSNSMANICYIAAEENSEFGAKAPSSYLLPYQSRRGFAKNMARHLIPCDEKSALWTREFPKGYREFLKQRTKLLCAEFTREVEGMKLFRNY